MKRVIAAHNCEPFKFAIAFATAAAEALSEWLDRVLPGRRKEEEAVSEEHGGLGEHTHGAELGQAHSDAHSHAAGGPVMEGWGEQRLGSGRHAVLEAWGEPEPLRRTSAEAWGEPSGAPARPVSAARPPLPPGALRPSTGTGPRGPVGFPAINTNPAFDRPFSPPDTDGVIAFRDHGHRGSDDSAGDVLFANPYFTHGEPAAHWPTPPQSAASGSARAPRNTSGRLRSARVVPAGEGRGITQYTWPEGAAPATGESDVDSESGALPVWSGRPRSQSRSRSRSRPGTGNRSAARVAPLTLSAGGSSVGTHGGAGSDSGLGVSSSAWASIADAAAARGSDISTDSGVFTASDGSSSDVATESGVDSGSDSGSDAVDTTSGSSAALDDAETGRRSAALDDNKTGGVSLPIGVDISSGAGAPVDGASEKPEVVTPPAPSAEAPPPDPAVMHLPDGLGGGDAATSELIAPGAPVHLEAEHGEELTTRLVLVDGSDSDSGSDSILIQPAADGLPADGLPAAEHAALAAEPHSPPVAFAAPAVFAAPAAIEAAVDAAAGEASSAESEAVTESPAEAEPPPAAQPAWEAEAEERTQPAGSDSLEQPALELTEDEVIDETGSEASVSLQLSNLQDEPEADREQPPDRVSELQSRTASPATAPDVQPTASTDSHDNEAVGAAPPRASAVFSLLDRARAMAAWGSALWSRSGTVGAQVTANDASTSAATGPTRGQLLLDWARAALQQPGPLEAAVGSADAAVAAALPTRGQLLLDWAREASAGLPWAHASGAGTSTTDEQAAGLTRGQLLLSLARRATLGAASEQPGGVDAEPADEAAGAAPAAQPSAWLRLPFLSWLTRGKQEPHPPTADAAAARMEEDTAAAAAAVAAHAAPAHASGGGHGEHRQSKAKRLEPHHGGHHEHEHGRGAVWDEAEELEKLEERCAEGRRRVWAQRAAVGAVYASWGVMAWMIFTYGKLIYDLIGPAEEAAFSREWGIAVGLDNAAQWQDVIQEAVSSTLKLLVLQRLRLVPAEKWLEESLDALSVQATLLAAAARGRWDALRAHLSFNARVEMD